MPRGVPRQGHLQGKRSISPTQENPGNPHLTRYQVIAGKSRRTITGRLTSGVPCRHRTRSERLARPRSCRTPIGPDRRWPGKLVATSMQDRTRRPAQGRPHQGCPRSTSPARPRTLPATREIEASGARPVSPALGFDSRGMSRGRCEGLSNDIWRTECSRGLESPVTRGLPSPVLNAFLDDPPEVLVRKRQHGTATHIPSELLKLSEARTGELVGQSSPQPLSARQHCLKAASGRISDQGGRAIR